MKWKCMICGYTFEGDNPPESCPGIVKHKSRFNEIKEFIEITNKRGQTKTIPLKRLDESKIIKRSEVSTMPEYRTITVTVEESDPKPRYITIPVTQVPSEEEKPKYVTVPVTHMSSDEEKPKQVKIPVTTVSTDEDEDPGVDYAAEYKKQTGRDLETGEYVTQ